MIMVFATVKYRVPGFHSWPDAPDNQKYLRNLHRHVFHFTIWLEVFHDDREVEFIKLKEELKRFTELTITEVGNVFSCEMLAGDICDRLGEVYPGRKIFAWVEEDGENGAIAVSE